MKTQQTKPAKPLNIRQERFCEFVVSGMSATEAYMKAGYNVTESVARTNGSRMLTNAQVIERIAVLRKPQTDKCILTKDRKLQILAEIIETTPDQIGTDSLACQEFIREEVAGGARGQLKRGQSSSGNEVAGPTIIRTRVKSVCRLRAIELHSKLSGDFAPEQVVIETGPKTLDALEARAKEVVSALDRNAGQK